MTEIIPLPSDYGPWLSELKARIHAAQQRAARTVNSELVLLYLQTVTFRKDVAGGRLLRPPVGIVNHLLQLCHRWVD